MTISLNQLSFVSPTPQARRLLWHVLSIGRVLRDEPERHDGLDKPGAFLFWVHSGTGHLSVEERSWRLRPGPRCWLLDLSRPRVYIPVEGQRLVTEGIRFCGPGLDAWLEAIGGEQELSISRPRDFEYLKRLKGRLAALVRRRPTGWEWKVHVLLTNVLGVLLKVRGVLSIESCPMPAPVARVIDAVQADPRRAWKAQELAPVAMTSYSALRAMFKYARRETLHDFLRRTRLDQARLLLCDPRLSVKEVAYRLSFPSEFAFSHFFREATGVSPSRFRTKARS